jgi:hypothetical protein
MYFPQLTHAYEAPHAQDWSQYMPSGSPFSGMGGLLYQPGTQEYMEQFPMPENLLNYQPPQINRQPVQYMNSLFGPMEVIMPESEDEDKDEYDPNKDPGWDEPRDPYWGGGSIRTGWIIGADGKGYATDKHGMVIGPSGYPSVSLTAKHNPQQKVSTTIAQMLGITLPTATENALETAQFDMDALNAHLQSRPEVTEAGLLGGTSKSTDYGALSPGEQDS